MSDTTAIPAIPAAIRGGRLVRVLVAGLVLLYVAQLVRTGWLSDDAFISLRVADNLVGGRGMTWNAGDRVLVVTNPLWTLLLAAAYAITREPFFTTIALSSAVSIAALLVMARRIAPDPRAAALGVGVLAFSQTFVDFSTSGLENPLTHLLLASFLAITLRGGEGPRELRWMALFAGLGMMTRLDTALLYAPPLIACFYRHRSWVSARAIAQGLLPFALWCAFALLYFGSPIPNTAIAKLDPSLPGLWAQGLRYLQVSAEVDPLLAVATIAGPALAIAVRLPRALPIVAGIALNLLYVVSIGGDFMVGRFLTGAFFCSVALIVSLPLPERSLAPALAIALLLAAVVPIRTHVFGGGPWHRYQERPRRPDPRFGIVDERLWYRHRLGLIENLRAPRGSFTPGEADPDLAERLARGERAVQVYGLAGLRAFRNGPNVHMIDSYALTDPLIARLPALTQEWRPGHARRVVPPGYLATLRTGENQLTDPRLAALHEKLDLIHRGPLLDGARFRAIAELLIFGASGYIDAEFYRAPRQIRVRAGALSDASPVSFLFTGVVIRWDRPVHVRSLRANLSEQHAYYVRFFLGNEPLATVSSNPLDRRGHEVATRRIKVPPIVQQRGFDIVVIEPSAWSSDQQFQLGAVKLGETAAAPRG